MAEFGGLLGRHRLLTLTGPGDCGKTRLALEARGRVAGYFADGVRWTWLASVSDPDLVPEVVARSPGLHGPSGPRIRRRP